MIEFDNALAEKDQELLLLKEKLQIREMELARWKLSNLSEPAIQSGVAKTPTRESVSVIEGKSQFVSAAGKGVDVTREEYPASISTHLTGTRPLSVTKQRGQTFETSASTTADESLCEHNNNIT